MECWLHEIKIKAKKTCTIEMTYMYMLIVAKISKARFWSQNQSKLPSFRSTSFLSFKLNKKKRKPCHSLTWSCFSFFCVQLKIPCWLLVFWIHELEQKTKNTRINVQIRYILFRGSHQNLYRLNWPVDFKDWKKNLLKC